MSEHLTLGQALTVLAKNDSAEWLKKTFHTKEELQEAICEKFLDETNNEKARFYQVVMNRLN